MAKIVYVKGSIRKDAVEITHKECRITEARLLESLYAEGWIPYQLKAVEVDELPSPAQELDRLVNLYGDEAVAKAYGTAASARQAVAELLDMDTPAQVKRSGILVENDAVPLVLVPVAGTPKKGGSAAASDGSGDLSQAAK